MGKNKIIDKTKGEIGKGYQMLSAKFSKCNKNINRNKYKTA